MLRGIVSSALALAMLVGAFGCGGGSTSGGDVTNTQSTALTLSSVSPSSALAGSPDLKLSLSGSNFDGSVHRVNQIAWSAGGATTRMAASFQNNNQLTVVLPAALLAAPVTASFRVEVWDAMGDAPLATSNALKFTISQPAISISPASATVGSPDLVLNITAGTFNFSNARHKFNQAVWYANGQRTVLNTTFVSTTQMNATLPATLLTTPVTAKITVEIWDFQGDVPDATSSAVDFKVLSSFDY